MRNPQMLLKPVLFVVELISSSSFLLRLSVLHFFEYIGADLLKASVNVTTWCCIQSRANSTFNNIKRLDFGFNVKR